MINEIDIVLINDKLWLEALLRNIEISNHEKRLQRELLQQTRSIRMGAKYTSNKADGYQSTRNNIYLEREAKQQVRTYKEAGACRNLPPQTKANYGKVDYK